MMDMEKVDFKELRSVMKKLNELEDLKEKMRLTGVKKKDMVENFLGVIEQLDTAKIEYPVEAIHLYNKIVEGEDTEETGEDTEDTGKTDEETEEIGEETGEDTGKADEDTEETGKKDKKEKTAKEKEKEERKKKEGEKKEKDEFGCLVGTNTHKFCMAVKKKSMTMGEVKKLPWNDTGSTFYEVLKILKEKGLMDVDEKKKIFAVEN